MEDGGCRIIFVKVTNPNIVKVVAKLPCTHSNLLNITCMATKACDIKEVCSVSMVA